MGKACLAHLVLRDCQTLVKMDEVSTVVEDEANLKTCFQCGLPGTGSVKVVLVRLITALRIMALVSS